MTVLSDEDRQRVTNALFREASKVDAPWSIPTSVASDWRAAVNATDDWIENNQFAFNAALPTKFRNNGTLVQKTFFFCAVALARAGVDTLKRFFGEVD
jgi:hypothetical protein